MEKEHTQYATYNGLNRPAMYLGIPFMLLLTLGFVGVFGTALFAFLFGLKGLIFTGVVFLFGFAVKLACEADDNAINVIKLNLRGWLLNVGQNISVLGKDNIVGFDSTGMKK